MRPSVYKKEIMPNHKIRKKDTGVYRNATIKDFYDVTSHLTNQEYYPDLEVKFVNLITPDVTISDIGNLRGMSKTQKYRDLPVKQNYDSIIYLETKDKKCIGKISSCNNKMREGFYSVVDVITAALLLGYGVISRDYILSAVGGAFGLNAVKHSANAKKSGIEIEVGSPEDIMPPSRYMQVKIRKNVESLIKRLSSKDMPSEFEEMISDPQCVFEIGMMPANLKYGIDELEVFKNFVNHINQIKL